MSALPTNRVTGKKRKSNAVNHRVSFNPTAIAQTGNTAPLHNFPYGVGPRGFTRRQRYGVLNPYTTISPLNLWSTPRREKRTKYRVLQQIPPGQELYFSRKPPPGFPSDKWAQLQANKMRKAAENALTNNEGSGKNTNNRESAIDDIESIYTGFLEFHQYFTAVYERIYPDMAASRTTLNNKVYKDNIYKILTEMKFKDNVRLLDTFKIKGDPIMIAKYPLISEKQIFAEINTVYNRVYDIVDVLNQWYELSKPLAKPSAGGHRKTKRRSRHV